MKNKYKRSDDKVIGKIIAQCTLENTSPLLIASGNDSRSEKECIRWVDGSPYIPSSALIGALKSWHQKFYPEHKSEYFWGSEDSKKATTYQSHFVIDDCRLTENNKNSIFSLRDGVAIDYQTQTASDKSKYDYELLEPGCEFHFNMEVTVRYGESLESMSAYVEQVFRTLNHELFSIGALTTSGFGKLSSKNCKLQTFDFTKGDPATWFDYLKKERLSGSALSVNVPESSFRYCKIDTSFLIKSALITGAYPSDSESPDKVHLHSKGNAIISGKALRGSLRHRAHKILQTIGHPTPQHAIHSIFGHVKTTSDSDRKKGRSKTSAVKSRLIVEESIIENGTISMLQDRIKIDRWTGGVMGGAKFDSQPIWNISDQSEDAFQITLFLLDPNPEEIALLLHLIKDLWTSDLAIGGEKNVGRGVLVGQSCQIHLPDHKYCSIVKNGSTLTIEGQEYLDALNSTDLKKLKYLS
ncbi:MAG: RAMP superfamily CRISPR-associated protein [Saprospiraceae bacterium]|nr:RAMP superfamily CRISPR-associated protein [Saprospiraceae bacterium]